jgi:hypothetical protein
MTGDNVAVNATSRYSIGWRSDSSLVLSSQASSRRHVSQSSSLEGLGVLAYHHSKAKDGKGMPSVTWWIIGQNFMTKLAGEVFTTCLSGRDISRDLHPIIYVYATLSSLFGLVCLI